VGGSAVLASQCYDRVHITVRDATGSATCDARVSVIDADGDTSALQPCYSAALTEGKWTIRAERQGYTPMTTSLVIPEHDGCPYYTHSVDISLTPIGAAAVANQPADVARARAAAAAAAKDEPEEAKPAGPPRRAFELLTPGAAPAGTTSAAAPGAPPPAPESPAPAAPAPPAAPARPPPPAPPAP
jgi:hypothetical protein